MATVYKSFLNDDVISTRTLLHEAIPITGSIVSGTYADSNIKNYSHGRFQSVYDYNWQSSSANHIFDITVGYSAQSGLSASSNTTEQSQKIQMYNQMAQMLVGHDITGSILRFDEDGTIFTTGSNPKLDECVFLSFSRLLVKDEIKKGSIQLVIGTGSYGTPFAGTQTINDYGAASEYRVNSPAGEYGILYSGSSGTGPCGLVFYQAGIMVLTASVFDSTTYSATEGLDAVLTGSSIQDNADIIRHRIQDIDFNNTVELNSTIYFCRVNHNEFNYSSNPTYLSSSQIRVKENQLDSPTSYITTVGLYSSRNELLAVAKLSEPLKKTPENELILRVRLDY
jgi:hypothetical protein